MATVAKLFATKGTRLTEKQLARYPIIVAGTDLPEKDAVYAFDSRRAFNDWVRSTKFADKVSHANKLRGKAMKYEKTDNTAARERQKLSVDRITNELKELSRRTGLDIASKELLLKATVERHPLESSIFDPVILFDRPTTTGSFLPLLTCPMPNLGWFGWNDRASCALAIFGGVVLFQRTWFRGGQAWIFSVPYGVTKLADIGFDNIASSAIFL